MFISNFRYFQARFAKIVIAITLSLCLALLSPVSCCKIASAVPDSTSGEVSPLDITAKAAVLIENSSGRILYENGEFLTLDKDRILHGARAAVKRLYG